MTDGSDVAEVFSHESRTQRVKLIPPKLPSRFLAREALERRLDAAAAHRVTAVVAAAGFGKSTHLASRALANDWSWYTLDASDSAPGILARGLADALRRRVPDLEDAVVPTATSVDERGAADSLAVALSQALDRTLSDELVLVVDDVHELGRDAAAGRVLEGLARHAPPELHLVLSSRDELPFTVARLRGQGSVLDFDGSDFVFTVDEIAATLGAVGAGNPELARRLHEVTAGWPVAVQLAIDMLGSLPAGEQAAALEALGARRGPLFAYLAEEIFVRERSEVRELLRLIVDFDRVTPELCAALGLVTAGDVLDDLARRGLLAEAEGSYTPHALVRQFAAASWPLTPQELRELRRKAGAFFEAGGDPVAATRAFTAAGDHESITRIWLASWRQLDEAPAVETVLEGAAILTPSERQLFGDLVAHAHIIRGEVEEGRRWLAQLPPEKAAHFLFLDALAHMHRFEHRDALEKLLRARDAYENEIDPYCSLFAAFELVYLGRPDEARPLLAEVQTQLAGGENAHAAAEAQLLTSDLARCDGDLSGALAAAEAGAAAYAELGNVLGECSARTRVPELLGLLGRRREAVQAAAAATRLSERIGFSHFQAWTTMTRGLVLLDCGRLDEAADELELSLSIHERLLTSGADRPLVGLGDIHRLRGERAQARSAYERALDIATGSGSALDETLACAGLARLLADEDPAEALQLADRAVERAPGIPERIGALVAKGWALVSAGDSAEASAEEARSAAGRTGSPVLLAETLELGAFATADSAGRKELLQEALGIRRRLDEPHTAAIATVALASVDANAVTANELVGAEQVLRALGIQTGRAAAGLLATTSGRAAVPLSIETLGRFAVLREGEVVTPAEWQSKKARDLLKILITRRGQATPRDYVIELLWPDDDPARTSKRLAVAVNVLRNVLDPRREHGNDHFVAGGADGLRLELAHLDVDVETFFHLAGEALRQGEGSLLEAAEAAYAGEFLPEDRYEDWAGPLRDEARATYQQVVRALAARTTDRGAAVRYLLRVLAVDPFDEDANLRLVATFQAAGMHGEARRAYRRYVERMDDIGLEPAAYDRALEQP